MAGLDQRLEQLQSLVAEVRDLPLDSGRVLYFFPADLTVLEGGPELGQALRSIARAESRQAWEDALPPGYLAGLLDSLDTLRQRGLLGRPASPPEVVGLELGRVIAANTMRCNLSCTYCYNHFPSQHARVDDMTHGTLDATVDFLRRHRGRRSQQSLLFIGGETLMAFDLVKRAAMHRDTCLREGRDLFLALTTNGTLLRPEIVEFCNQYAINIKITLDGDPATHDRCRRFPDGRGSFATISALLPGLFQAYANPSKFVTTTVDTLHDDPARLLLFFAALGFNQVQLTEKYYEGGRPGPDTVDAARAYQQAYRSMAVLLHHRIRSRLYLQVLPLSDVLRRLSTREPTYHPCDAGIDALGVGTDGDLYPCHHFYGERDFRIGNVRDQGVDCSKLSAYRLPVTKREPCSSCWGRFLCGGPCYHRSLAENRNPMLPVRRECERKLAMYEEMIRLHHRLSVEDPAALQWYLQECARH